MTEEFEEHNVDPMEKLRTEVQEAKAEAEANLTLAKTIKAEYENYRKRNSESLNNSFNDGRASVVAQIIPLADALYEGIKNTENAKAREGIEILIRKFQSVLASLGVEEIESVGKQFDPHQHNAVAVSKEAGKPPDTVLEEWQKGYRMNGRVLRPATVKVNK